MTYRIEKNIPTPERMGRGAPPKYPWREMQVGDSFLISICSKKERSSVATCANYAARHTGMKFCTRKDGDGLRVWRIA